MKNFDIELKGFDEFVNKLDSKVKSVERVKEIALGKGAFIVQRAQISEVPIRTGKLKRALKVGPMKTDAHGIAFRLVGDIDNTAAYGWIVEAKHKPFMAIAMRKSRAKARAEIKRVFSEAIKG